MGLQSAFCGCTMYWKSCWMLGTGLAFVVCVAPTQADIYQWVWANPERTLKQQSTTLCPDGAGVTAAPGALLGGFGGRDFTRAYLIGADLTGAMFSYVELVEFGSNLSDAEFSNANLTEAFIRQCVLTDANFAGAIVSGADFSGSNLTAGQLYGTASYAARDLHGIRYCGSSSTPTDLSAWNLASQNLTGANLSNSNLTLANLSSVNLTGALVCQCNLDYANLEGATVAGTSFSDSNLTEDQLHTTASYRHADLHNINLSGSSSAPTNLSGWNLANQDLTKANLSCTDLTAGRLSGANLTQTNLSQSLLNWADLSGANLTEADFTASTLTGANLTATNVTRAVLADSKLSNDQLYSTLTYQTGNLDGIVFGTRNGRRCTLTGCNFAGKSLQQARLDYCGLPNANFSNANLTGASFYGGTLTDASFAGATIVGTSFTYTNLTASQLCSTASYQAKDLHGIALCGGYWGFWMNLNGWDFAGQNLTGAFFEYSRISGAVLTGAVVAGADFLNSDFTSDQLYGTASYQAKDLHNIILGGSHSTPKSLVGWNFADQNLAGARFTYCTLGNANFRNANLTGVDFTNTSMLGADLTGTTIAGANFDNFVGGRITVEQIYSSTSYHVKDLHGIVFGYTYGAPSLAGCRFADQNLANTKFYDCDLSGADLSGANLMRSYLMSATLDGTDLSRADLRGTAGASLESAITQNTILPDGSIRGLDLAANERLVIRNYTGSIPGPIEILTQMSLDPTASLQMIFDGQPWGATISFGSGISAVSLEGELDLTLAPGVQLGDLVGMTFKLFDWTGVSHSGQFDISGDPRWSTSHLYTSGEITFAPEPSGLILLGVGTLCLLGCVWRQRQDRNGDAAS
jgi:uncharacterized protein YjbI with pentapeptide repeats